MVPVPLATNPRLPKPGEPGKAAGYVGRPVVDELGCVQLVSLDAGPRVGGVVETKTVWPYGYTARLNDGVLEVLNRHGRVVASPDVPFLGGGGDGNVPDRTDPCLGGAEQANVLNSGPYDG
jgi:hypothetical protein